MTSSIGADLPVPDEAKRAYDEVTIGLLAVSKGMREPGLATFKDHIRAIAAPVVAAELRRLADEWRGSNARGPLAMTDLLRARADALDADRR